MRISSKGRYALASAIYMGQNYGNGEYTTVISISEKLAISKIYLEQVFSLLKRGEIVTSVKGAQGGYLLSRPPERITAFDILSSVEVSLFEKVEDTVSLKAPEIEIAMQNITFKKIDEIIENTLKSITLLDLITEAQNNKNSDEIMFYI